jgi:xanthine dehydrogenase accessory factor
MRELLDQIDTWRRQGKRVALATIVSVEGSTPRQVGTAMALTQDGDFAGSVSGGCIESDVFEHALEVIDTGMPKLVTYGFSEDMAFEIGLACGGAMHIFIERLDALAMPLYSRLAETMRAQVPVGEVTIIDAPTAVGGKMLVFPDGTREGGLGLGGLDAHIADDALQNLQVSRSETRRYTLDTDMLESESQDEERVVQVFIKSHVPSPTLFIVGAGHASIPLASMAGLTGFHVVLIDARAALATRERFPHVDELVVEWPHEALAHRSITDSTYVAVLTHDAKFEEPLLPLLLRSEARYIGVIGSRSTQAARRDRLRAQGFVDRDLQRLRGPIGLDIGAVTPEEIALSIMAEIVARRHDRPGGFLGDKQAAARS